MVLVQGTKIVASALIIAFLSMFLSSCGPSHAICVTRAPTDRDAFLWLVPAKCDVYGWECEAGYHHASGPRTPGKERPDPGEIRGAADDCVLNSP